MLRVIRMVTQISEVGLVGFLTKRREYASFSLKAP